MTEHKRKESNIRGRLRPPTDGSPHPLLKFGLSTPEDRARATADEVADFMNKWAPPGSDTWWIMTIEEKPESGRQTIRASLNIPGLDSWELGEARVSRIGGRNQQDAAFQTWLYAHVGAAAVAGGRIEAAMKRLILSMSGTLDPAFADAEDQWAGLEKKLRVAASAKGERATDVIEALDWGQENKVRETRNDIIHAYWWDYADAGITRGRVHRDGTSELIIITPQQLVDDVDKLQRYADALDSVMDHIWLNIYLPRNS